VVLGADSGSARAQAAPPPSTRPTPPQAGRGTDSTTQRRPPPPQRRAASDSLRPPISPGRAFLYSFALPGFGQSRLQRHAAGAVYTTIETVAAAMAVKASNDLRIARAHAKDSIATGYKLDANGVPQRDSVGRLIPNGFTVTRYTAQRVKSRRGHYEDWIAILIFNHLFSGADAFVSAQLWDLPSEVGLRAAPTGWGLSLTLRW
jgi:hypothetical protein